MSQTAERRQDPIAAVVARRVRELRDRRGWSGTDLAERMAEAGLPQFDRGIIANLESGRRRSVSIDEVLVLAQVLDVAPVHLFVPVNDAAAVEIGGETISAGDVRRWVRGEDPLPGQNSKVFRTEVPSDEWDAVETLQRTARELLGHEFRRALEFAASEALHPSDDEKPSAEGDEAGDGAR